MKKILITGSSGFLGARILQSMRENNSCVGLSHMESDITDSTSLLRALEAHRPDFVIHCAAVSDTAYAQSHPEEAWAVNVCGTQNIAHACAVLGARLIYMSSDQVYNGNKETHAFTEEEKVTPMSIYACQKLEAEQTVQEILPDAVGLRLTWMYDLPNYGCKTNANLLFNLMKAALREERLSFAVHEQRGITYVREVVGQMEAVLALPGGIYNYGSRACGNTYETAQYAAGLLQNNPHTVIRDEKRFREQLRNLSMNTQKAEQNGIFFSDTFAGMDRCLRDYGYR